MVKVETTVSYMLSFPEGTRAPPSLTPTGAHAFAVEAGKTGNVKEYYEAVRQSIAAARQKVGEELTAWRDAVGNAEAQKEKVRAEDDNDEEQE